MLSPCHIIILLVGLFLLHGHTAQSDDQKTATDRRIDAFFNPPSKPGRHAEKLERCADWVLELVWCLDNMGKSIVRHHMQERYLLNDVHKRWLRLDRKIRRHDRHAHQQADRGDPFNGTHTSK